MPRRDRHTVEIGDDPNLRKVAGGFRQDLLRAVAPRDVGEEQFADRRFARQPACGSGGQMATRPGKRRVPFEELLVAARTYSKKIRSGFGPAASLLPPLRMRFYDLGRTITLGPGREMEAPADAAPDIECHSSVAHDWFTKPYGTDSTAVGAHFRILSRRKTRLVLHLAAGLLVENRLAPKSLLSMLASRSGAAFLWNRREEILGILLSRKVYADYHKE